MKLISWVRMNVAILQHYLPRGLYEHTPALWRVFDLYLLKKGLAAYDDLGGVCLASISMEMHPLQRHLAPTLREDASPPVAVNGAVFYD